MTGRVSGVAGSEGTEALAVRPECTGCDFGCGVVLLHPASHAIIKIEEKRNTEYDFTDATLTHVI